MEDGNPNDIITENNLKLINFTKRDMISKVIREIQGYQYVNYNIKSSEDLARLLDKLPDATEEFEKVLYELSLKREPRQQS